MNELEIKTTLQIFNDLCDDCGTGNHERPNDEWISVESLKNHCKKVLEDDDYDYGERVGFQTLLDQLSEVTKDE